MTSVQQPAAPPQQTALPRPWPLAGTADFERLPPQWRARLAERLQADLVRHVARCWFPRSVDRDAGGFLCDFDARWRPLGEQPRMLEFQARQTRTAARLALAFPDDPVWPDIARHGFRYLRDVMRDAESGGFYTVVDRSGTPLANATKHAHGTAYALSAFVDVFLAISDAEPLALANEAFDWLERHARDPVAGGYFGWTRRDGSPIRSTDDVPVTNRSARDPLGHGIGVKDANVHSDLLDAYTTLYSIQPTGERRRRVEELYDLLVRRFATPAGALHYLLYSDMTPVPHVERFGYPFQTAYRLIAAGSTIGRPLGATLADARALVDHATEVAWQDGRGAIEAAPALEPFELSGRTLRVDVHPWWVQCEAAKAHVAHAVNEPQPAKYAAWFERDINVIEREFLDRRNGGWLLQGRSDSMGLRARLRGGRPKGSVWKDASHEADFYLYAIRALRGIEPAAPIG